MDWLTDEVNEWEQSCGIKSIKRKVMNDTPSAVDVARALVAGNVKSKNENKDVASIQLKRKQRNGSLTDNLPSPSDVQSPVSCIGSDRAWLTDEVNEWEQAVALIQLK